VETLNPWHFGKGRITSFLRESPLVKKGDWVCRIRGACGKKGQNKEQREPHRRSGMGDQEGKATIRQDNNRSSVRGVQRKKGGSL